jgi:Rieske 2Fe-2S family protein
VDPASAHPDYVMTHRMLPLAPNRTWVECSWYFPASRDGIDPRYAVEFWDLTNRQD